MDLLSVVTLLILLSMPPSIMCSSQYNMGNIYNNILTHRKMIFPKQVEEEAVTSYAVIFDAGSTGSRLHVYHFDQNLDLLRIGNDLEFLDKVTPGLSAYANNSQQAAESLVPLLEEAESVVPEELHSNTPVKLGATAGLRILDGDASEKILEAVRDLFKNRSSLNVQSDAVAIIDGTQEGSYLWVTINYLLGKLGKKFTKTVGVVDLGGGSVQMTYAVSRNTSKHAPTVQEGEDPYIKKLVLKGNKYDLYIHSYLRFGQEAFRAESLKIKAINPCLLLGFNGSYTYSGVEYEASAPNSGANYNECKEIILEGLKVNESCAHPNCTFGGIWDGGKGSGQRNLYLTSSFYYMASDTGIVDSTKPNSKIRPVDLETEAKRACELTLEGAKSTYPRLTEERVPYVCIDLAYQYTLLVDGFGIDPWQEITVANQIEYRDAVVETAWPLGTAIEAISSLPKFYPLMYFI